MTFRGNTKQTAAFWAAVAFFIVAIMCAIESGNSGDPMLFKVLAGFAAVMGLISTIGVWTMGLSKAQTPEH
jgi:hypothetical protein